MRNIFAFSTTLQTYSLDFNICQATKHNASVHKYKIKTLQTFK